MGRACAVGEKPSSILELIYQNLIQVDGIFFSLIFKEIRLHPELNYVFLLLHNGTPVYIGDY